MIPPRPRGARGYARIRVRHLSCGLWCRNVFARYPMLLLRSASFAVMIAAALPAAHAAKAPAPQCPATWPSQPAAWVAHIEEVNRGLGIPPDYAAKHNLVPLPEGKDLTQAPPDVYGRKVEMVAPARSEERRVGKECRYRWSGYHWKKNSVHHLRA